MACESVLSKLADVPLARDGFGALEAAVPALVQLGGRAEQHPPAALDQQRLKAVVQHLVSTNALVTANTYCCQCAAENLDIKGGTPSNYVPVIMMPIYPADECPFNMECDTQLLKNADQTKPSKKTATSLQRKGEDDSEKEDKKKTKKRGFVIQRLTDFDLMSQWSMKK